jgi:hypothetical protein
MRSKLVWTNAAWEDDVYWQSQDKKTLKRGINYKDIDKSIRKLNIKDDIDVVEVVLDLAKIQSTLDRQSNEFLSKFFDN